MSDASLAQDLSQNPSRTPWHLWLVGVLAFLWNLSGAITIWLAQAGRLATMSADEAEYYAAQSLLFVIITNISLVAALAGAAALLLRRRAAAWLFGTSLVTICITNSWDLLAGTSRSLVNTGALVVSCIIFVLAILQLIYARAMQQRGVLR